MFAVSLGDEFGTRSCQFIPSGVPSANGYFWGLGESYPPVGFSSGGHQLLNGQEMEASELEPGIAELGGSPSLLDTQIPPVIRSLIGFQLGCNRSISLEPFLSVFPLSSLKKSVPLRLHFGHPLSFRLGSRFPLKCFHGVFPCFPFKVHFWPFFLFRGFPLGSL